MVVIVSYLSSNRKSDRTVCCVEKEQAFCLLSGKELLSSFPLKSCLLNLIMLN